MKKDIKKLQLNKLTVTLLQANEQQAIQGGLTITVYCPTGCFCPASYTCPFTSTCF
jgi:hypothetical protein